MSDRRLLLVHAHPDDETIGTGATMARYAAEGAHVALVTCTLGEEGEILVPSLSHLAADQQDDLGTHRIYELDEACKALGVDDHRFLGGPRRWRDSGMMGTEPNDRPGVFWQAPFDEAVAELVAVIREVRPQVVVTYDEMGGYGHPDHIQAHRVTVAAYDKAGDPSYGVGEPWAPSKLYWTAFPKSVLQASIDRLKASGQENFFGADSADDLEFGTPDALVTTAIDGSAYLDRKIEAMRAHATQIEVDGPFFALSNNLGQEVWGTEYFTLVRSPGDGHPASTPERETDLFDGVA